MRDIRSAESKSKQRTQDERENWAPGKKLKVLNEQGSKTLFTNLTPLNHLFYQSSPFQKQKTHKQSSGNQTETNLPPEALSPNPKG